MFSLYLPVFYHFSSGIKVKKSNSQSAPSSQAADGHKSVAQSLYEKYLPVSPAGVYPVRMNAQPRKFSTSDPLLGAGNENIDLLNFPMKFKECLRRVIGRRSYGDNLPIFKKYWRHTLKSIAVQNGYPKYEQSDEYLEERVLALIEMFKRPQGVDVSWFRKFSAEIPLWRKEHLMKPQRQAAAKARWLKEKSKKGG